ncbi:hypothetical protein LI328DRAFT_131947 [Trichoderma asperelloides]|nr:hypothetical protein LI328DRAFT_131947 [Trichoderma asperelloides]
MRLRELRHHLRLWRVRMSMRILLRLAQLVELVRLNREIHCERATLTFDAGGERNGCCFSVFRYSLLLLSFFSSFLLIVFFFSPFWLRSCSINEWRFRFWCVSESSAGN